AVQAEEAGEHEKAVQHWQAVKAVKSDAAAEQREYGRVADKHLRLLAAADGRLEALTQKHNQVYGGGLEFKPESENEAAASGALRYQRFGDLNHAAHRWALLRLKHEKDKDPDNRPWFLLAARQAQDLKGKTWPGAEEKAERLKFLQARVDE